MTARKVLRALVTPLTLAVLLAFLGYGAWWGYRNVMRPIPARPPDPCVTQSVGPKLKSSQVTVNVYNGGYKQGLATTVAKALKAKGFMIKHVDNTDERIKTTVIVGADANNPEVKLVAAHFKNATVRADQRPDHTVDVLVGNTYGGMDAKAAVEIAVPGNSVCLPSPSPTPTPTPATPATPAATPPATPKR
ncbi:LytR C-terminal domain-containing protein [Aestuariimicrobium ganziense]|uniref:LytR C-terminal domain-containing protein n=1 Tax=Aestuariimicrobium ganziense TaxID=2773677 RepID=UPI00194128C9|nr:LytR C-terminal domain-containing protein [Aestuariimicrobium ganziense]